MILTPFLGYAYDRSIGSKMGIIPKPFEMISGAGSFELNYHTAIYFGKGARELALDSEMPSPGVRHTLDRIGTSCAMEVRESGIQIQMTYHFEGKEAQLDQVAKKSFGRFTGRAQTSILVKAFT